MAVKSVASSSLSSPPPVKDQIPEVVGKVAEIALQCDFCGKTPEKLLNCSRCKQTHYCGADCQKGAYKTHKVFCLKISQLTPPLPGPNEQVCLFRGSDGEVVTLTQRDFFKKTGAYYTKAILKDVKAYPSSSSNSSSSEAPGLTARDPAVKAFEAKPPVLIIDEEPPIGLGLRVGEDIPEKAIICFYNGLLNPPDADNNLVEPINYSLGPIDAKLFRNEAAFINDGPPNSYFTFVANYKNLPEVPVVVAARNIKKGERIHTTYDKQHSIKGGLYHIDEQEMAVLREFVASRRFFKPKTFSEIILRDYLFTTMPVFFRLLLEGSLDVQKVKKYLMVTPNQWRQPQDMREPESLIRFNWGLTTDAAEYLLKRKNEDPLLIPNILAQLLKGISYQNLSVLLQVMLRDPDLSADKISSYAKLGKLLDTLRLFVYGSFTGLDREKVSFTTSLSPNMKEEVAGLPVILKKTFLDIAFDDVKFCRAGGYTDVLAELTKLLLSLK